MSICKTYPNGDRYWWRRGKLHRIHGPAVEYKNGSTQWYKNGKMHRDDGPAAKYANGETAWYQHGKLHREDGPAIEYADVVCSWWINGTRLTPTEFAAKFLDEEHALLWKMSGYCWPFEFRRHTK